MMDKPKSVVVSLEQKEDLVGDALVLLNKLQEAAKLSADPDMLNVAHDALQEAYTPSAVRKERKIVQRFYTAVSGKQPAHAASDDNSPDMGELREAIKRARMALENAGFKTDNVVPLHPSPGHS